MSPASIESRAGGGFVPVALIRCISLCLQELEHIGCNRKALVDNLRL